jgi:dihydroxyacetone kinase-like protein
MGREQLTLEETRQMFLYVADRIEGSKDLLTRVDRAIGDGDHGIGMARGFEAVRGKLEGQTLTTIASLLRTVGMALVTSVGGAAGAVFGTWFVGGAKGLGNEEHLDSQVLALALVGGLEAVKQRGRASLGDKTMVDALEPAARQAEEMVACPLDETLEAATEAARQGMERTKEMVATIGKAKTLGDRSVGHPDPGAMSVYLILKSMTEYVKGP